MTGLKHVVFVYPNADTLMMVVSNVATVWMGDELPPRERLANREHDHELPALVDGLLVDERLSKRDTFRKENRRCACCRCLAFERCYLHGTYVVQQ